jgi:hypothetical protein
MDNLYAEKFAIGGNDPEYSYDGTGLSPEQPIEQSEDGGTPPDSVTTFENDPEETEVKEEVKEESTEETTETNNNILMYLVLGVAMLFFYKKK